MEPRRVVVSSVLAAVVMAGCAACAGSSSGVVAAQRASDGPLRRAVAPPSPPPDAEDLFIPMGERRVPGREWSSYGDCYSEYDAKYNFSKAQSPEDTGRQLLVEISTGRAPSEPVGGVLGEEGPVELIPLESVRAIGVRQPPQSEGTMRLRGVAKLGRLKGAPVFTDKTTGQLYVLPTGHAELVRSFDESKPPSTSNPARK